MENEFKESNEKRRVISNVSEKKSTNIGKEKKRKKIGILDILTIVTLIVLVCIYVPRGYGLYKEIKTEDERKNTVTYPLKVSMTDDDSTLLAEMLEDYAIGILSDVEPTDGFDDTEKVNFVRHVLSEKYSSSGVVAKSAINNMIKKYFDVDGLDYTSLGFKKLSVYEENEPSHVYNITKLEQYDEAGEIYLAHIDKISKENVVEGKYDETNVEGKYIFTLKKIKEVEETAADTSSDEFETGENTLNELEKEEQSSEKYRYIFDKVEEDVQKEKNVENKSK